MTFGLLLGLMFGVNPYDSGPPSAPAESLAQIRTSEDIEVELVASEPLVVDPVAIAFDERGRMFVAEYRDYPTGPARPDDAPLSRIRLLIDDDHDGRMDRSKIFADELPSCQGLCPWRGGLIATVANRVLWIADHDGDDRADVREVLCVGLGRANTQLQPAFPTLGIDRWVYVTNGLSGGEIQRPGRSGPPVNVSRSDFRFDPLGDGTEPATGLGQFGQSIDDWGDRFTSSNRRPIMHAVLPYRTLTRNPFARMPEGFHDCATSGAESRVYPLVATATTASTHVGTHTAACGVHIHRGDGLGDDYVGNAFVCDPTAYLVARHRMAPDGVTYRAERIARGESPRLDWLVSSDRWFRPVSMTDGPDGALYLCDMYRAVIEHPVYMPPGVAEKVDPRAGDDRGRIYRLRARGTKLRPYRPASNSVERLALLEDPVGWRRSTAFRQLIEAPDAKDVAGLRDLAASNRSAQARSLAVRILESWGTLDDALLGKILGDEDPRVVEQGLRILGDRSGRSGKSWAREIVACAAHADPRVRFAALLAWPELTDAEGLDVLAERVGIDADDPWIQAAVWSIAKRDATELAIRLLTGPAATDASVDSISELVAIAAAGGEVSDVRRLLATILDSAKPLAPTMVVLEGFAKGLDRRPAGELPRWPVLLRSPPMDWVELVQRAQDVMDRCRGVVEDAQAAPADRVRGLRLLASVPGPNVDSALLDRLSTGESAEIQAAALEAISRRSSPALLIEVMSRWENLSAPTRGEVIPLLLRHSETIRLLLDGLEAGRVSPGLLGFEGRAALLAQKDPALSARAEKLLGGEVSTDRREVFANYLEATRRQGDGDVGRALFERHCANCHRVADLGVAVGPDLGDVRGKSAEQLLGDILDPNRMVEPRFFSTTVLLNDGRVFSGLLTADSAGTIRLKLAGGKEEELPRRDIESFTVGTKSLMPEGIERDVSVEQMADLLRFLRGSE